MLLKFLEMKQIHLKKLFKADFMQLNKQVGSKMIKIKDNEKKEILEMAEEIAFSIVGDVADKEDAQSSIPLATALVNAHYRKQSETVKEFAEKVNVELNKLKNINRVSFSEQNRETTTYRRGNETGTIRRY